MNESKKGLLLVFIGVLLMSIESPLIKLSNATNFQTAFYYGFFMSISTFLILLFHGKNYLINAFKIEIIGVVLAGVSIGFSNIFFITAIKQTSVANVLLILATAPIVCTLLAKIFFKQQAPRYIFIVTFFILIGLFIMLYFDFKEANMFGNILAFGSLISFSSLFVIANRYKYANRFAYIFIGGLIIGTFGFTTIDETDLQIDKTSLYILVFLGLFTTPISRYLIGIGAKYIHPAQTGILTALESVIAPILAIFIIHEYPKTNTIIGGVIILFAIIFNSYLNLKNIKTKRI